VWAGRRSLGKVNLMEPSASATAMAAKRGPEGERRRSNEIASASLGFLAT